ncbi:uncharacterized protein LOC122255281 [Penaeus japonicus]|uniref:uncharacterized protein LOC122255281 n=1 Tax=Penaeus japonicus TaxID=27405 RepID=UPI001C710823|nr:uncharacterized protein LOC122255281 [Penaeus japonicus]
MTSEQDIRPGNPSQVFKCLRCPGLALFAGTGRLKRQHRFVHIPSSTPAKERRMVRNLPSGWQAIALACILLFFVTETTACDSNCQVHRLTYVGLPLKKTSSRIFWWPEDDVQELSLVGEGLEMALDLQEHQRNQWHEVKLEVEIEDERRGTLESYTIAIPTLAVRETRKCAQRSCESVGVGLGSNVSSLWALECSDRPCACFRNAKLCATDRACSRYQLTGVGIPLDSPRKVFWQAESVEPLSLAWADGRNHSLDLRVNETLLAFWLEVDVRSRVLVRGSTTKYDCILEVASLGIQQDCSSTKDTDYEMRLTAPRPNVFGLGCTTSPAIESRPASKGRRYRFLMLLLIAPVGIAITIIALAIVRWRNRP